MEEIPGRLSILIYWVWLDHNGNPSARELQTHGHHLCSAIGRYGDSLTVLNIKPYRLCEELWSGSLEGLHRCNIDMLQFCHCRNEESPRDQSVFDAAYQAARNEERLPRLEESQAMFQLRESFLALWRCWLTDVVIDTPGISFR